MDLSSFPVSSPAIAAYLKMLIRATWPADPRVPIIAVTGSTCTGKSQLCYQFSNEDLGKSWMFAPEMYTELVLKHGMPPADPTSDADVLRARATVFFMQLIQERDLGLKARHALKTGIIEDRGLIDNAAFLPGGLPELLDFVGTTREQLFARYDMILHLGIIPEADYFSKRENNPTRPPEPYAEVVAREERLRAIYSTHHRYRFIPYKEQWGAKKMAAKMDILDRM